MQRPGLVSSPRHVDRSKGGRSADPGATRRMNGSAVLQNGVGFAPEVSALKRADVADGTMARCAAATEGHNVRPGRVV